ncbi:glycosyltransferase family 39 protein [Eubacteriales bacterium OttesenSCG-928-K08]|nr:glycosyltransferase family 39 protein [Eubacteriales bacterium OttesenSCG-928-K08]
MFKKTIFRLSVIFYTLLISIYVYWLFNTPNLNIAGLAASAVSVLVFGIAGADCLRSVFLSFSGEPEVDVTQGLGARTLRPGNMHPVLKMFLALLLSRIIVYILAYALSIVANGYEGALLDTLWIWNKGDAPHYLGIAQNWYVTQGDPRFHIVFMPFYPLLVNAFNRAVGNIFVSGMALSLLFTVISGLALYELALLDMDRISARRAVKFQMLLPAAFLLSAPMSDALFLMLSILCLLAARKKQYLLACLVGGLAAFTRILGVILIVPVFVEILGDMRRIQKESGKKAKGLVSPFLALLLIPAGLGAYLFVNLSVTGNAFQFLTYQKEHWGQQTGWFFNTANYQTNMFLSRFVSDPPEAFGLWLPNLICLILTPVLMLAAQRVKPPAPLPESEDEQLNAFNFQHVYRGQAILSRLKRQPYPIRASYMAYFLAYYAVSMGATWLLSAPRYLMCCFPVSIALASCLRNRRVVTVAYVVLFLLQMAYMYCYVAGWPVY